jgi:hypothetical protein
VDKSEDALEICNCHIFKVLAKRKDIDAGVRTRSEAVLRGIKDPIQRYLAHMWIEESLLLPHVCRYIRERLIHDHACFRDDIAAGRKMDPKRMATHVILENMAYGCPPVGSR